MVFFLLFKVGYSESENRIGGRLMCNDVALKNVDVINLNSEQVLVTNEFGRFSIEAQIGNKLMLFPITMSIKQSF